MPGYVCENGAPSWHDAELLSELDSFLAAYKEERVIFGSSTDTEAGVNVGGNGVGHHVC